MTGRPQLANPSLMCNVGRYWRGSHRAGKEEQESSALQNEIITWKSREGKEPAAGCGLWAGCGRGRSAQLLPPSHTAGLAKQLLS